MRGNEHLAAALAGHLANQVVHLPLQDDVLMGVRLVEQNYGRRAGVEEGQQQEHLERTATGVGQIEGPIAARLAVFADDVRLGRGIRRREHFDLKEYADVFGELPPVLFAVFGNFPQQVPQNLARTPLTHEQILHPPVAPRLVALNTGERRDVDDVEGPGRRRGERPDGRWVEIFGPQRTHMDHFGIGVLEFDPTRPRLLACSALDDDLDQPPRPRHTARAGDLPPLPQ